MRRHCILRNRDAPNSVGSCECTSYSLGQRDIRGLWIEILSWTSIQKSGTPFVDLIHRTAKSHQPTCKNPVRALLAHSQVQQSPAQSKVKLSSGSKGNRFGTIARPNFLEPDFAFRFCPLARRSFLVRKLQNSRRASHARKDKSFLTSTSCPVGI
jgi:hypothetical protein